MLCINRWMEISERSHDKCRAKRQPNEHSFQPTRLLDIGTSQGGKIQVIETKEASSKGPYATLSHCWGRVPSFVTLNYETYTRFTGSGVDWAELPLNFQEAIEVARTLRIPYISIDSLCIVQRKDLDPGDFDLEAPLMHKVYRHALCNIAVADSENAEGGLFRNREPAELIPGLLHATPPTKLLGDRVWRIVPKSLWESQLLGSHLYTRAWVFQERMLALRLLHFAYHQIFWDCAEMSACETFPSGIPQALDTVATTDRHWRQRLQYSEDAKYRPLAGPANDSLERFWQTAVANYTRCDLTNRNDKLLALWGIAKLVRDAKGEEFYEGLWQRVFEEQLAWVVVDGKQANGIPSRRPTPTDFPSWSWASVDGMIELPPRIGQERDWTITDHDYNPTVSTLEGRELHHHQRTRLPRIGSPEWKDLLDKMDESVDKMQHHTSQSYGAMVNAVSNAPLMDRHLEDAKKQEEARNKRLQEAKERDMLLRLRLECRKIRLLNAVGQICIKRLVGPWKWAFDLIDAEDAFEVYPDEDPLSDNVQKFFVILAVTRLISTDGEDEAGPPDLLSGIGLLLDPVSNKKNHFVRWGSFRFTGISFGTFDSIQNRYVLEADCLDDVYRVEDNGWKIWVE